MGGLGGTLDFSPFTASQLSAGLQLPPLQLCGVPGCWAGCPSQETEHRNCRQSSSPAQGTGFLS